MAELTLLQRVKNALGVTGDYQDATLTEYIAEVKAYMLDAGVSEATLEALSSVGVIARGVIDLWDYGAGNGKLSSYFYQRVTQLAYKERDANV